MALIFSSTGAGAGEGESYQRVHVHNGSPVVGAMDHLVHQTVSLPLRHIVHRGSATEGIVLLYVH